MLVEIADGGAVLVEIADGGAVLVEIGAAVLPLLVWVVPQAPTTRPIAMMDPTEPTRIRDFMLLRRRRSPRSSKTVPTRARLA